MAFWVLSAAAHKTSALPARINLARGEREGERERKGGREGGEGGEGDALIRQPLISILQCNK